MVLKNGQDCFQLWSGNLVFAFIGVSQQAHIFGCGCLKRKCPLRCNISYSGGDIANVGWHIGLGSWYLKYLNYIFWLYCGRRLYLLLCTSDPMLSDSVRTHPESTLALYHQAVSRSWSTEGWKYYKEWKFSWCHIQFRMWCCKCWAV